MLQEIKFLKFMSFIFDKNSWASRFIFLNGQLLANMTFSISFLFHPVAARVEVILNGDGRQVLYFLKNLFILYSLGHL
jgi:hypothetical protein